MSSTTDKLKGLANEAVGNVKQAAGKVTGNDKLVAEGKAQELKGEAQRPSARPRTASRPSPTRSPASAEPQALPNARPAAATGRCPPPLTLERRSIP